MSRTKGRLNLDCDPADQPDGSYRFALNAVESGDENLSNEQSNVNSIIFPKGHVLLGHVYVGDNQTCVFSVDPITHASSIGVIDAKRYYHTQIDDGAKTIEEASGRLNFSLEHQIYGIYRLRNGSEVGMTSNHHAPYVLGFTHATMAGTEGCDAARRGESLKAGLSSDRCLQLDTVKLESLVIANQHCCDEYILGPCVQKNEKVSS